MKHFPMVWNSISMIDLPQQFSIGRSSGFNSLHNNTILSLSVLPVSDFGCKILLDLFHWYDQLSLACGFIL